MAGAPAMTHARALELIAGHKPSALNQRIFTMERIGLAMVFSRAGREAVRGLLHSLLQLARMTPKIAFAIRTKLLSMLSSGNLRGLLLGALGLALRSLYSQRAPREQGPVDSQESSSPDSSPQRTRVVQNTTAGWFTWRPHAIAACVLATAQSLRVAAGTAAQSILKRCPGPESRPIFEKKREVIFELLQPLAASPSTFPANTCWLDLYAGTGCMGLEALSRGARVVHFVEDDVQVTREVLSPNVITCNARMSSVIHNYKVEHFLGRARKLTTQAAPPFHVICLAPPCQTPASQALALLDQCPLISDNTLIVLEYAPPKAADLPATQGQLVLARHCRLGQSWLAVYAAASRAGDGPGSEPMEFDFGAEDEL